LRRTFVVAVTLAALFLHAAPASATFPGGNGRIAFQAVVGGQRDIYSVNPDGTDLRRLTDSPAGDYSPAWSPDGRKIVFASDRDGNLEIYLMNADGSGQTRLTEDPASGYDPDWSPDGRRIAFTSARSPSGLYVMDADGSDEALVAADGSTPAWSPAGGEITFVRYPVSIWAVNPDTGAETFLLESDAKVSAVEWTPDAGTIIFVLDQSSGFGTQFGAYTMSSDGSDVSGPFANGASSVVASPDGSKIALNCGGSSCATDSIYVQNADGTGRYGPIATGSDLDWQPIAVGPRREDFANGPQFCRTERDFMGAAAFTGKYGADEHGANAFGKCVAGKGSA
jgi:Tol biopolymer transport system component